MKISTESIEGFEGMSAEDKLNAVLAMEMPDPVDMSGYVKKSVFDAKASEAASLSKQLKEKMSAAEIEQAERDAKYKDMETKYAELQKSSTISAYKSKYLAMGMDETTAQKTAEYQYDGNADEVFNAIQANNKKIAEEAVKNAYKNVPKPKGSSGNEEKSASVKLAEQIGQNRSKSKKAANDILAKYIK